MAQMLDETQQFLLDHVDGAVAIIDARQRDLPLIATNRAYREIFQRSAATEATIEDTLAPPPLASALLQGAMQTVITEGTPCKLRDFTLATSATIGDHDQNTLWDLQLQPVCGQAGAVEQVIISLAKHDDTKSPTTPAPDVEQDQEAFLSLLTHEIKSPLTSIKGFSQLAMRAIETNDDPLHRTERHLRIIKEQADRIDRLISDLGDLARLQRGQLPFAPMAFALGPIIQSVVDRYRAITSTHQITLTSDPQMLIVRADPQRIQQAVGNLIQNAVKYSPNTTKIAVSLTQQQDAARITVRDWGLGISADAQSHIFERFYRAANGDSGNLGLGLFIAQQVVQQSGGTLTVESEEGVGSSFHLDLPLAEPDPNEDF